MTSLLNFIKIYQLVQKLLGGRDTQTDRQTDWWSHKPHFPFFSESRLKKDIYPCLISKLFKCKYFGVTRRWQLPSRSLALLLEGDESQRTVLRKCQRAVRYIVCMRIVISSSYLWNEKIYCTVYYLRYPVSTSTGITRCQGSSSELKLRVDMWVDTNFAEEHTASKRPTSTSSPSWEPQISYRHYTSSSNNISLCAIYYELTFN
jgi:hypothetical protein